MANIIVEIPQEYKNEMVQINKSLKQFSGYPAVASSLGKFVSQEIVAGLIGCIIPESGSDHTILNAKEYKGNGVKGTEGWNCGEGLIQWTYWKYKLPLIKKYNADSKSTQKLPTVWEDYKMGEPVNKNGRLHAVQDGRHIAGLTLDNQMLFLTIYYQDLIKKLQGETNLAVIVAKIYQQKAGVGFYKDISDPIVRAYITARNKYPSSTGNHYLQSLKIAQEYIGAPITPSSVSAPVYEYSNSNNVSSLSSSSSSIATTVKSSELMSSKSPRNKIPGKILGTHMKQK